MNAQGIMMDSRVAHVRELKAEISRLREENSKLSRERDELLAHFDLALLAAADLAAVPPGGKFVIYDGWNLVLGAGRTARTTEELEGSVRRELAENPLDRAWIVYDGPVENAKTEERLRIGYTGGTGAQRADRLICDFIRMARFAGRPAKIELRTNDKKLAREAERLLAEPRNALAYCSGN